MKGFCKTITHSIDRALVKKAWIVKAPVNLPTYGSSYLFVRQINYIYIYIYININQGTDQFINYLFHYIR